MLLKIPIHISFSPSMKYRASYLYGHSSLGNLTKRKINIKFKFSKKSSLKLCNLTSSDMISKSKWGNHKLAIANCLGKSQIISEGNCGALKLLKEETYLSWLPKGPSMFFYPDFILISSRFYPNFILILFRFYPDFILILSRFHPDFFKIRIKLG